LNAFISILFDLCDRVEPLQLQSCILILIRAGPDFSTTPSTQWPGLADFSFCFEEPGEILSRLGAGTAMDAGADFFVP
jgi:hypothetical protein